MTARVWGAAQPERTAASTTDASAAVRIKDTKASRQHARLISQGGVVEIEDLDSSNGTLLNGKPVQKRMLRHGDVIKIGTTEIRFDEQPAFQVGSDDNCVAHRGHVNLFPPNLESQRVGQSGTHHGNRHRGPGIAAHCS